MDKVILQEKDQVFLEVIGIIVKTILKQVIITRLPKSYSWRQIKRCAEAFPFKLGLRSVRSHKVLENTQILILYLP